MPLRVKITCIITSFLFVDIQFKVDNGTILAHKPILMARCEMMYAMFNDNFMEASADLVIKYHLPFA